RPGDLGAGPAEVKPVGEFLGRLVQRVVDLLQVDLAHHVERRVCHLSYLPFVPACRTRYRAGPHDESRGRWSVFFVRQANVAWRRTPGCPSGQRELTVNQPALAYGGSNP